MATDEEITQAIETIFEEANPNIFSSINDVIQHLQSKLGFQLAEKHDFIRAQIHQSLLLCSQHQHQQQLHYSRDHFALQQPPNYPFPPQFQNPTSIVPKHEAGAAIHVLPEASKECAQTKPKRKGGPGGLNKLCGVSPELQVIVGQPTLPRTEIVKQLWAYIRKNSLQDPSNKRKIICNDELRLVFDTDCTDMFKMNKLLAKHIYALEPSKPSTKKKKVEKVVAETKITQASPSVIISEVLANFFGSAREMPQSEVIRRIWEYIKINHLEDPVNALVILCDGKLQAIFGCESIPALGIPEMLARHHLFKRPS